MHDHPTPPPAVTITPDGAISISTTAWIAHRSRGIHTALTEDLHRWGRRPTRCRLTRRPNRPSRRPNHWPDLAQAWCLARRHRIRRPGLIVHAHTRLDTRLWVLPAATADGRDIAVIGHAHRPPTVHADGCPDPWTWHDADSVRITCPTGHAWTWSTGRELLTSAGLATTVSAVFGPDLDAPFTPCPTCRDTSTDQAACRCDHEPWITCPICGHPCTLTLPDT